MNITNKVQENYKIAILGMGYVGLPLAVEFGKKFNTIGFDISKKRVFELKKNLDVTKEISQKEIKKAKYLSFSTQIKAIKKSNIYIVCVPTPVNSLNKPDLKNIKSATTILSKIIKPQDIVIYESTVYPGLTEDICVPILEKNSKLIFNNDFFVGYSPERINPGDKLRSITKIKKVVSGSSLKSTKIINQLYKSIITEGTYVAKSIKVAEAAKVIENTQRDLNIALINELSQVFNKLNISTKDVLEAARTKWNFVDFKPGLVGGHCIGVDPYYLTYKSKLSGYNPKIILAGRKLNDSMPNYIANIIKKKINSKTKIKKKILLMGLTFKENCADCRNSKVKDLYYLLKKHFMVDIFDPWVCKKYFKKSFSKSIVNYPKNKLYDCVVICVAHKIFKNMGVKKIIKFCKKPYNIYDIKNLFNHKDVMQLL